MILKSSPIYLLLQLTVFIYIIHTLSTNCIPSILHSIYIYIYIVFHILFFCWRSRKTTSWWIRKRWHFLVYGPNTSIIQGDSQNSFIFFPWNSTNVSFSKQHCSCLIDQNFFFQLKNSNNFWVHRASEPVLNFQNRVSSLTLFYIRSTSTFPEANTSKICRGESFQTANSIIQCVSKWSKYMVKVEVSGITWFLVCKKSLKLIWQNIILFYCMTV